MSGAGGSSPAAVPAARNCAHCRTPLTSPIACAACGRLQTLPAGSNHFSLLGLPAAMKVDLGALERAYLKVSRMVHPDFFANRPEEQTQALRLAAAVNEAYRTLKTPIQRAEYLLLLAGGKTSGQDRHTPPGFLQEMLLLREEIEDGEVSAQRRTGLLADVEQRMTALLDGVTKLFHEPANDAAHKSAQLVEIRGLLNSYHYLETLKERLGNLRN
jgi:molecular chaperone HscB